MAPRISMTITAAGEGDPGAATPSPLGRFHAVIIVEGVETGDKRIYQNVTWRDTDEWPLMAQDWTDEMHLGAILVGNFDTMEKRGPEIHGWGPYLSAPSDEAARLIGLIQRGELRGISADMDDIEYEVLFPLPTDAELAQSDAAWTAMECEDACATAHAGDDAAIAACRDECQSTAAQAAPPTEVDPETGREYEVVAMADPKLRVTEARVMGATALPFPALQEAFIEHDAGDAATTEAAPELVLTAGGAAVLAHHRLTGVLYPPSLTASAGTLERTTIATVRERPSSAFDIPAVPPAEWFSVPEPPGPMPLTIMDDGQVFGHLAVWGECHIGFSGECVEPPPSRCSYGRFHVGEIKVDGGVGRMSVGRLTFRTGHAPRTLAAGPTVDHYDHSGSVGAYLRAMDGEHGIWTCGALVSTLSTADVQEVMANPPSGDWRRFGNDLELVAALAVPVPGFNTVREQLTASGWASLRKDDGLVESLIISRPAAPTVHLTASAGLAGLPDRVALMAVDLIADAIGRGPSARVAALYAAVHGG